MAKQPEYTCCGFWRGERVEALGPEKRAALGRLLGERLGQTLERSFGQRPEEYREI